MKKRKNFALLVALALIVPALLSACGQQAATPVPATATTAPAAEQPTNTTEVAAADTPTTMAEASPTAMAGETPAAGTGDFDPSAVPTIEVEEGATLRVSGCNAKRWRPGQSANAHVGSDAHGQSCEVL